MMKKYIKSPLNYVGGKFKLLEEMLGSTDLIAKLSAITFYYALRREEVLGWKWSQIDMEKKSISLETAIIDISEKESPQKILKKDTEDFIILVI